MDVLRRWAVVLAIAGAAVPAGADTRPALPPGASVPLIVRWVVEDGYYIDAAPASSVAFRPAAGTRVEPARVKTSGRVIGGAEEEARLVVEERATPGPADIKASMEIFFCSLAEKWCKRITRTAVVPLAIVASPGSTPAPESIQLEVVVPLDDER